MPFELGDRCGMFAMHEDADGKVLDFDGHLHGLAAATSSSRPPATPSATYRGPAG